MGPLLSRATIPVLDRSVIGHIRTQTIFPDEKDAVDGKILRTEVAAAHGHPENEVPHPHDFVEFGLVNTKPCCMSVSW